MAAALIQINVKVTYRMNSCHRQREDNGMAGLGAGATRCDLPDSCAVAMGCSSGSSAVCVHLLMVHAEKSEICDQLEAIADSLPDRVDPLACLKLAGRLVPSVRQAHLFEEQVLFPLYEANGRRGQQEGTVSRLKAEHLQDECAAEDITEILMTTGHGRPIQNPEAFGFMLRAFFEAVRRHLASERALILPTCAIVET
jgi:iron-sulfur cluster repair protein YtfE (RIC family)